jgi:hypothetical protein
MSLEFLLGLPYLRGPLLARARELGAPVLVSANSFSRWKDQGYWREWRGFRVPSPEVFAWLPVHLDSAGFVAAAKYRGWPWAVENYLDLCAAAPWRWFASMDWCVEPEVAADEDTVLDRISGTVRLNVQCLNAARERGIQDRLMPVIQGWEPDHYLRCLDRLSGVLGGYQLVGVGSMCRRHVEGVRGVLQVVDALDRAAPAGMRFHLFGLKSQAAGELRGHPRIASVDSQAYGVRARQLAIEAQCSKSEAFVADVMASWYRQQADRLTTAGYAFRHPTPLLPFDPRPCDGIEKRIALHREHLRMLHESGEIDWQDVNPLHAYYALADDDDDENPNAVAPQLAI